MTLRNAHKEKQPTKTMNMKDPNLGKRAKDKVTGLEGIIIGKIDYLTGCNQYGIMPAAKDNKPADNAYWVDCARVEILGNGVSIEEVTEVEHPGGPQNGKLA